MVEMFRNTNVSMANTKAWIKPTNISKPKNGSGAIKGIRKPMTASRTSPAKIFPNKRNAKEMIFESSENSSKNPTKKSIGPAKLKNFLE